MEIPKIHEGEYRFCLIMWEHAPISAAQLAKLCQEQLDPWTAKSAEQFITLTQWTEPDPTAVWSKASGLFVPVLPNPAGLFIATAKLQ